MADNVTVTNKKTTFDADTNPDLAIRTSETASGKQIQHVRLDLGTGTSESVVTTAVPVSGTVTVNAGTNLNTSALALESGGNLATIAGKDFATQTTLATGVNKLISTGSSAQQVQGAGAIGAAITTGNGMPCYFKDLFGNAVVPTGLDASGVTVMGVLPLDVSLHVQQFSAFGEVFTLGYSTNGSYTGAKYALVNSSGVAAVDNTRQQTVLYAVIDFNSSGDNPVVSADATKKIKVLSYSFVCAGSVNVRFKSSGTSLTGAMPFIANTGMTAGPCTPSGGSLFETAVNESLRMNLSAAVQVSGHLSYYLEA